MAASLTISRVSTINADNLPQTVLQVTGSVEIGTKIFVFTVDDRGAASDTYKSIATIHDLETLPVARDGGAIYYLKDTATILYEGIQEAVFEQKQLVESLKLLVSEYNTYKASFEVNDVLGIE